MSNPEKKVDERMVNKEYCSNYYQKNRDEILKKRSEKIVCDECGFNYTYSNKTNHYRTKKHKEAINRTKIGNLDQTLSDLELINKLEKEKLEKLIKLENLDEIEKMANLLAQEIKNNKKK